SNSKVLTSLQPERIEKLVGRFPTEVAAEAEPLLKRTRQSHQQKAARLAELMSKIGDGNPERGQKVFYGNKAACHTCHRANGKGGQVGPELSLIGRIRSDRDLAESIVFPSSTIVNGYETFEVIADGQRINGVIGQQSADSIHLRLADKTERRIERDDIEEMTALPNSIMPEGLEKGITHSELSDLIAYLRTLK
ncbi:MAG: c-type cytochrome, partial [Planctomycetales bacterium]